MKICHLNYTNILPLYTTCQFPRSWTKEIKPQEPMAVNIISKCLFAERLKCSLMGILPFSAHSTAIQQHFEIVETSAIHHSYHLGIVKAILASQGAMKIFSFIQLLPKTLALQLSYVQCCASPVHLRALILVKIECSVKRICKKAGMFPACKSQSHQLSFFLVPVLSAPKSARHSQPVPDGWMMYFRANSLIPKVMTSSRQRTPSTERDIQMPYRTWASQDNLRPTRNWYQHRSITTTYS